MTFASMKVAELKAELTKRNLDQTVRKRPPLLALHLLFKAWDRATQISSCLTGIWTRTLLFLASQSAHSPFASLDRQMLACHICRFYEGS